MFPIYLITFLSGHNLNETIDIHIYSLHSTQSHTHNVYTDKCHVWESPCLGWVSASRFLSRSHSPFRSLKRDLSRFSLSLHPQPPSPPPHPHDPPHPPPPPPATPPTSNSTPDILIITATEIKYFSSHVLKCDICNTLQLKWPESVLFFSSWLDLWWESIHSPIYTLLRRLSNVWYINYWMTEWYKKYEDYSEQH